MSDLFWQTSLSALPICVLALLISTLRWWTPRWRMLVLVLAFVRLAVPVVPGVTWHPLPQWSAPIGHAETAVREFAGLPADDGATAISRIVPLAAKDSWTDILPVVWLGGCLSVGAWILLSQVMIGRRTANLIELHDDRLQALLQSAATQIRVRSPARLMTGPGCDLIALTGLLRPRLMVPPDLSKRFDRSEIVAIFRHELAHQKRHDILWNWLILALCAVHWFNPLVWLMFHRWRVEVELRCDELALRGCAPGQRRDYGDALLKMWQALATPVHGHPHTAPFIHRRLNLKKRVAMIMKPQSLNHLTRTLAAGLVTVLAVISFTAQADGNRSAEGGRRDAEGAARPGPRDGEGAAASRRDQRRPSSRQAANVFRAYDKNRDGSVTVDEWLAMRHLSAKDTSSRAKVERGRFQAAEPSGDGRMTEKEFVSWYTTGRFNALRDGGDRGVSAEGAAPRPGVRDGEGAARRGPRDGEGAMRKGPRDGEGAPRGPRDGEGVRRGPRDGEGGPRGPRDGEGVQRGPRDGEGEPSREGDSLSIWINSAGQLLDNGRVLSNSQRGAYLRRLAASARGRKIYLHASRGASSSNLQALIRECQAAGIKNLYLAGSR